MLKICSGFLEEVLEMPTLSFLTEIQTSVKQLIPVGRPPGFLKVPRGSSGLAFLACLDAWTFETYGRLRGMDV